MNEGSESGWNRSGIYLIGLCTIAAGLPLSKPLISIGLIITIIGWINERGYSSIKTIPKDPILLLWILLFLLHLIGMLYTENQKEGWHDVKVKLPLILVPLLLIDFNRNKYDYKIIFKVFIAAVLLEIIKTLIVYFTSAPETITNIHNITGSLSHIRLGSMINLCVLILIIYFVPKVNRKSKYLLVFLAAGMVSYLIFLQSLSSLISLIIITAVLLFISALRSKSYWKPIGITLMITILLGGTYFIYKEYQNFSFTEIIDFDNLPELTSSGNLYSHDIRDGKKENGHFVGLFTSWEEMENEWGKKSKLPFNGKDKSGNYLKFTLQRYLSSKGLTKDSTGVNTLTIEDISNIEQGIPNYLIPQRTGLVNRLHSTFFEIQQYLNGGDPSGHTLSQRFEYWKTAVFIISKNSWHGVGTGDMPVSFSKAYADLNSPLLEKFQLRSHNQFLAFGVAFGFFGIFIFISIWIITLIQVLNTKVNLLVIGFFLIAFFSMLTEDTLETQVGVTFTLFFFEMFRKKNE